MPRSITKWKHASKLTVCRTSPCGAYSGPLDRGVNFFVLMLEQLGAQPEYSCEGHPAGFYVLFSAPVTLAQKIVDLGYFRVELERKRSASTRWSIRADFETEDSKTIVLSHAADAWCRAFGPLTVATA